MLTLKSICSQEQFPANIYLLKVYRNRKKFEIFSKLLERRLRQGRHCGIFIVNFKHISHLFLMFLLLDSNK